MAMLHHPRALHSRSNETNTLVKILERPHTVVHFLRVAAPTLGNVPATIKTKRLTWACLQRCWSRRVAGST